MCDEAEFAQIKRNHQNHDSLLTQKQRFVDVTVEPFIANPFVCFR